MKRILLVALVMLGFATLVYAKGEGPVLGKAWQDTNAVCATIATKDDNGKWQWDCTLIAKNGDKAEESFAKIQAEVSSDEVAKTVKGVNSLKRLNTLIAHGLKAIKDCANKPETSDEDETSNT